MDFSGPVFQIDLAVTGVLGAADQITDAGPQVNGAGQIGRWYYFFEGTVLDQNVCDFKAYSCMYFQGYDHQCETVTLWPVYWPDLVQFVWILHLLFFYITAGLCLQTSRRVLINL